MKISTCWKFSLPWASPPHTTFFPMFSWKNRVAVVFGRWIIPFDISLVFGAWSQDLCFWVWNVLCDQRFISRLWDSEFKMRIVIPFCPGVGWRPVVKLHEFVICNMLWRIKKLHTNNKLCYDNNFCVWKQTINTIEAVYVSKVKWRLGFVSVGLINVDSWKMCFIT